VVREKEQPFSLEELELERGEHRPQPIEAVVGYAAWRMGRYNGSTQLPKHKTAYIALPCLANEGRHPADRTGESLGKGPSPAFNGGTAHS
jgi:hypothetical protein